MDFILKIIIGQEVLDLLEDHDFINSWSSLASMCEKVTVMQEYPFVSTWYRQYQNTYEPIMCLAHENSGRLIGIMPLAKFRQNGQLTIAGEWQAEYHGWICDPQIEDEFPISCLVEIKRRFKPSVWKWRWLPPGTSTDWLVSDKLAREGIYVRCNTQNSPVWDLADEENLNSHLKNKTVLNQVNRYKRRGDFRFERVRDKSTTEKLMEVLRHQSDFRHEMVHETMPFTNDMNRAAFYAELQKHPESVHFSVMWLNDKALAFNFGACDRTTVYLGLTGFDPRESKTSPGTQLLLEIAKAAKEEGYTRIDLTPGFYPYKERFANAHQIAYEPTFYFTKKNKFIADLRSTLWLVGKRTLSTFGLDKVKLKRIHDKVIHLSVRFRRITPRRLLSSLCQLVYSKRVYVYYRVKRDESFMLAENDSIVHVQRYEDLFGYAGSNPYVLRRQLFSEAFRRFGTNEILYSINVGGALAHYGWMTRGGKLHSFTSVNMTFQSPEGSMILCDFYTDPRFRRQGLYVRNLKQMISDSFKAGAKEVFIGVESQNTASRRAVEKVGFTPFRTFSSVRWLWYRRKREYETHKVETPISVMYLIDTHVPPLDKPSVGGAEKQLHFLSRALDPAFFRPIVVQLIPESSSPVTTGTFGNVELFHFPTPRLYDLDGLRQIMRLVRLARERNVKIMHTFFEKSEVMGWLIARIAGVPIWITSRRDLGFKRKKVYDRIFKFASKDCTLCIANCQAIKDQVVEQENLDSDKVAVIYNGLDIAQFRRPLNGGAFRREIGADNNAPLIGMVANFNFEIKGHRYFIEAAKKVLGEIPGAQFVLVGDGQLRRKYEEMARSLGIQRSVHFLGKRDDVAEILAQLSISVLCSTSEGFSNVILESMAAGKPVVATNIGGNSEMVVDRVTGRLVPPADSASLAEAIVSLLNDPDMCHRMGEDGKRHVAGRFSIPAMVEGYEHLYRTLATEDLISKASPGGSSSCL